MKNSFGVFRPKPPFWNSQGKGSGGKALGFYFIRISKCFPAQNCRSRSPFCKNVGVMTLVKRLTRTVKTKILGWIPQSLPILWGSAPTLGGTEQLCLLYPTLVLLWSWGPWLTELHPNCAGRWLWRKRCPISGGPTTTTGRSTSSSSQMTSSWCSLTSWFHPVIMHRWVLP